MQLEALGTVRMTDSAHKCRHHFLGKRDPPAIRAPDAGAEGTAGDESIALRRVGAHYDLRNVDGNIRRVGSPGYQRTRLSSLMIIPRTPTQPGLP